jgi:hypothetical protein
MKRFLPISVVIIAILLIDACSKEVDSNKSGSGIISLDQNVLQITHFSLNSNSLKDLGKSQGYGNILDDLFLSTAWSSVPNSILSDIILTDGPTLADYKNSKAQTINFKLKSNLIYKTLTFYYYNGEFMPVILSSEKKDDLIYISVNDLSNSPYFDFYVNKDNKMGEFRVHMDMPRFKNIDQSVGAKTADQTCMQKTETFGDCMLCAIDECAHDWICAVVCTVMSPECLAGFALACTFD